ncbi:topoisomerase DNA-binding C4 zinc finger domain-containing protein [Bradyrhizobium sp. SZCCHNG3015]|uniref:topoisomerase DNA-binding C4 zinc finger domain-containing protein n=1 Tax=Bradyrhizobium sp. SZCCHNG3015 TaxID=3057270 RepID=UPI0028E223A3|nr:topoisomerase DNA-binding C4 zinc finger domain-containing protein [Bradyrhizobium sp. SZCCHNG3015]
MQSVKIGGKTYKLGRRIGGGGEGDVFLVESLPDQAVKIYKENLRISREPKVRAMVGASLAESTNLVAFPADIATDPGGGFGGFAMRLVKSFLPMHELYSPKSRKQHYPKADYRHLVHAAVNVARAVGKVHETGCVIGDFNHSGVLISQDFVVALIDADSFQFTVNGRSYPCVVGMPDFTPPELQGRDLKSVTRNKHQDNFGLAVAIFQLLSMGKHPYAGVFAGPDLTMAEAIAQNRFAFSMARQPETRTRPPPASISLNDFPPPIAQAFEAAFGLDPTARPDAAAWVTLLKNLEGSVSHCAKVKTHYYPSAARGCVWCRLTLQSGVDMFPDFLGDGPIPEGGPFDIELILAQIRAVSLPQPASLIPKWTGTFVSNGAVADAKREAFVGKAIGAAALVGAGIGLAVLSPLAVVWLGLGVFGLYKMFGGGIEEGPFKSAYSVADQRAREAELTFVKRIGLAELYGVREDLEGWIGQYRQLDADLNRDLANLRLTRESRQRDAWLDRYSIRAAKISGIGPAKTATLASFGIETAADVNETAVRAVPGFGEALTAKMMTWRRAHEAKFRYNPAPSPADAQAETALRSAFAAKRVDLQSKIKSGLAALQSGPQRVAVRAQTVDQPLMAALGERAKAARNLELLGLPVPVSAPITIDRKPPPTSPSASTSYGGGTAPTGTPTCPRCGAPMLRRTARRGRQAGRGFWGCSRYPACNGTRS